MEIVWWPVFLALLSTLCSITTESAADPSLLEVVVNQLSHEVSNLKARLTSSEIQIASLQNQLENHLKEDTTSTYTRWGRTDCPAGVERVYSGVIGGSWYADSGRAVNYLCVTMNPSYDNLTAPASGYYARLFGTEYDNIPSHDDDDAVCAVCRTNYPTSVMIPATNKCPEGWKLQYSGHLAAGRYHMEQPSEFICLDGSPEDRQGGESDLNGAVMYLTVTMCGSLPCPPFVDMRIATCVVCSK